MERQHSISSDSSTTSILSIEDPEFQDIVEKFKDTTKMRWIGAKVTNEENSIQIKGCLEPRIKAGYEYYLPNYPSMGYDSWN
jgi:hypothetical protein